MGSTCTLRRGAPAHVLIQTEDKFGNNCHGGGDQVDLVLQAGCHSHSRVSG
jgi:hypothetical protein